MPSTAQFKQIALKFAVTFTLALPAFGGVVIPPSQWGPGSGNIQESITNYSGPSSCYLQANGNGSTCGLSIGSNVPPQNFIPANGVGTAAATLSAWTDANGSHIVTSASGSGNSEEDVTAYADFFDTAVNTTSNAIQFQVSFHLDAQLYALSDAYVSLKVLDVLGFNQTSIFSQSINGGGAGTYNTINQTITTPLFTIAPNGSQAWGIILQANMSVWSGLNIIYPSGLPQASIDAGHTLSMSSISAFDMAGNALPSSALSSANGYTNGAATPEPATFALFGGTLLILLGGKRLSKARKGA